MTIKASSKQFQRCVNYWTKHTFQIQFLQFFTHHYGQLLHISNLQLTEVISSTDMTLQTE